MKPEEVADLTGDLLHNFLLHLAGKFPGRPLQEVLTNFLYFSPDGTESGTRLRQYGRALYVMIKNLELGKSIDIERVADMSTAPELNTYNISGGGFSEFEITPIKLG